VSAIQVIVGGHVFAAGLATYFGNETWYEKYLMPAVLRLTSPETGHRLAVKAAHYGLMPRVKPASHPELVCNGFCRSNFCALQKIRSVQLR